MKKDYSTKVMKPAETVTKDVAKEREFTFRKHKKVIVAENLEQATKKLLSENDLND